MSASNRVLMLVWTGVATDTRVLREARTLVANGSRVHIIGRAVPEDFVPPEGITVASAGIAPRSAGRQRSLSAPERWVRWALLPNHTARRMAAWQSEAASLAREWAARTGRPDVVHVHDFSALPVGHELAHEWGVPFLYDTHEYWMGRPVEGRPAPLRRRAERHEENRLGKDAAAVVTVGEGVARALRSDHPAWPMVSVVRNTFPLRDDLPDALPAPVGLVYGGRLAADRELEVIAAASLLTSLPITVVGPGDDEWIRGFDPGRCQVLPAEPLARLDERLLAAGAALVTHSDRWPNHRLAMPNKLFHAVSLGLPVVATDVGELGALVREHRLGTLYSPGDAAALADAVAELLVSYPEWVERVRDARAALAWESDAEVLRSVHAGMRGPR